MKKYGSGSALLLSSMILASACVNTQYDLSKEIETEVTIFENIALPIGSISKISIGDILFTDETAEMIRCAENGDYHLDFTGGSFETKVDVPSFSIDGITLEDQIIHFAIPSYISGLIGNVPEFVIKYSDIVSGGLAFNMDIDIDAQIPDGLVDVSEVYLDATMLCNFNVNAGKVFVSKGFELKFPDYLYISKVDNSSAYDVVGRNTLRFIADTEVGVSSPISLSLGFDQLKVPDGAIVVEGGVRKVKLNDEIQVKGDMYINTKDFAELPDEIQIVMNIGFKNLSVTEARVTMELESEIPSEEIIIGDLPDILKGDKISVDLYNPYFELSLTNGTPFDFYVIGDITAYSSAGSQSVHLGAEGPESSTGGEVFVNALSSRDYVFSRRALDGLPETTENIEVPSISNLIKNIPHRMAIHDMAVYPIAKDVMIKAGSSYTVSAEYAVGSPLSFDQDLSLEFDQEINGLGLDFADVGLHSAQISMNMINSIPLDLSIEAVCVDSYGNVLTDTVIYMDHHIPAGSHETPAEIPVKIILENRAGNMNVDGLLLKIKAFASDTSFHGVCLNREQGLAIRDIVLSLPDGIVLN